jgi:hypothetical protein
VQVEEALRQAEALATEELRDVEARCAVLAQYIHDGERKGARTAAWSGAVRELRALQDYRAGLIRRRSLIQQALECLPGECPAKLPLPPAPDRAMVRTQQQIQIRARRRLSMCWACSRTSGGPLPASWRS